MQYYKNIKNCRVCGEKLFKILKLQKQYIGTTFVKDNDSHPMSKVKIPLTLMICPECQLVQLKETVDPELLYRDYYYRTSINDTMKKDLKDVVEKSMEKVDLKDGDCVIDIGANDMTMIQMFPNNLNRIGVEPAKNIDWSEVDKSIKIVNDFFNKDSIVKNVGNIKAKIITSCAMFYDLDDPKKVVSEIKSLLHHDGICVIQISHLLATVKDFNFYDICHEHIEYYSLRSLINLMQDFGLEIYDVETNFVNGGSLRIYVCHSDNFKVKTSRYYEVLMEEEKFDIHNPKTYKIFDEKIKTLAKKVCYVLSQEKKKDNFVIGLGASTKSSVLLQVCGVDKDLLPCISERSKVKIGLKMLGLDIPLVSEEEARRLNPSMMVLLPWNFKKEILEREKEYIQNGGKIMIILPFPYYVDVSGEHIL